MSKIEYTTKTRFDRRNRACVTPYINGWAVGDIPVNEWTPAVQDAVRHAYFLGVNHAIDAIRDATANVGILRIAGDVWRNET